MTTALNFFIERRDEFRAHYLVTAALEERIFAGDNISIGSVTLSSRHLLTMKSGLIVHLYNIVEATMSRLMNLVGEAIGQCAPGTWSEKARKEWLREYGAGRLEGSEDAKLESLHILSNSLISNLPLGPQNLKKPTGTWTDKKIALFAERLGVSMQMSQDMWRKITPRSEFQDQTPLEFLAERRNALAHGRKSFEDGATDLTLTRIDELADVTLSYLEMSINSFQVFIDQSHFKVRS